MLYKSCPWPRAEAACSSAPAPQDELASLQSAATKLQSAYRQLAQDKQGMERRLGAELAATLSQLEVSEAEKTSLEQRLLASTKQGARPVSSSAFLELDNVLKTVDATREGLRRGETVRYEVVGDQVETSRWSLGSSVATKAAEEWAAKAAAARVLCQQVGQEVAYGTVAKY
jgi:hypothetical protein